ncbi:MAG: hypothetical protein GX548_03395 [Lentisphaerae bacterium]|nr:hypothetical protein [Lentisphaerota bacterium]
MTADLNRHAEMLQARGQPVAWVGDQLFTRKGHWVAPVGPWATPWHLEAADGRRLLRDLGGAWVMWTDGFGPHAVDSKWHAVICRRFTPVEDVSSGNTRSKIRRGLKNCDVRPIGLQEMARDGYETYCAACRQYGAPESAIPDADDFYRNHMADAPFEDIRHQWGVFHDGRMVGFAKNLLYGRTEVDYTMIKLHPQFLNRYISYALFHVMNEYYLVREGFEYVSDGSRTLVHETGVQDFLIKEFAFEQAPMGLHLDYRPGFAAAVAVARPFRGLLSRLHPRARAFFELDRMRR